MSHFLKFLLVIAAVLNLAFVFVFDGRIPSNLPLPFLNKSVESEKEPEETEIQPAETEETAEAETEIQTEGSEEEKPEAEEAETEEAEEALPRCRITAAGGSNVRSGPGTGFDIVIAYPFDTVLVLTGEPEIGWYPVQAEDGTEGYIFENQIEILDENAEEENVPLTEDLIQQ